MGRCPPHGQTGTPPGCAGCRVVPGEGGREESGQPDDGSRGSTSLPSGRRNENTQKSRCHKVGPHLGAIQGRFWNLGRTGNKPSVDPQRGPRPPNRVAVGLVLSFPTRRAFLPMRHRVGLMARLAPALKCSGSPHQKQALSPLTTPPRPSPLPSLASPYYPDSPTRRRLALSTTTPP